VDQVIELKRIGNHTLPLPSYGSDGAAGLDLSATHDYRLYPGQRAMLTTGFAWHIWPGYVGMIRPRSGLAAKHGIDVLAGVIDSDFRGEVRVILINHGDAPIHIKAGDRIAQMVIQEYARMNPVEVEELTDTARGDGGFGSTGQ
jgi:dUTP pyrophosphatase